MSDFPVTPTVELARTFTHSGSKQSFYTARVMVDKDLVDDFYRAYAYLRWADDVVDNPATPGPDRTSFIDRQTDLIDNLYRQQSTVAMSPEEQIAAELVANDRSPNSGLQSFIRNMLGIIRFDAYRKGRFISQQELDWYSDHVSLAVTDGIEYFIGNGHEYLQSQDRLLAARAAHIAHLLRDMLPDIDEGFINIPQEYLDAHDIDPKDVDSPWMRAWVKERVELARKSFEAGKRYLDQMDVLRLRIVGHWYCTRFEGLLTTIERDDFVLRPYYNERRKLPTVFKLLWQGISLPIRHFSRQLFLPKSKI
jgi:phytoene/squalene synthetase